MLCLLKDLIYKSLDAIIRVLDAMMAQLQCVRHNFVRCGLKLYNEPKISIKENIPYKNRLMIMNLLMQAWLSITFKWKMCH